MALSRTVSTASDAWENESDQATAAEIFQMRPVQARGGSAFATRSGRKIKRADDTATAEESVDWNPTKVARLRRAAAAQATISPRERKQLDRKAELEAIAAADRTRRQARELRNLRANRSLMAKCQIEKDLAQAGLTVETWFEGLVPDATFFGLPIRPSSGGITGVHRELYEKLQSVEAKVVAALDGKPLKKCREILGLSRIDGMRRPQPATGGSQPSLHCYGLAIDIDHVKNPFLRTATTDRIIQRATTLVLGKPFSVLAVADKPAWPPLSSASHALQTYFTLDQKDKGSQLQERIAASAEGGLDAAGWIKQIRTDRKQLLRQKDVRGYRDITRAGFLALPEILVTAMEEQRLRWGGSYKGGKDIMHVDWRDGSVKRPMAAVDESPENASSSEPPSVTPPQS